MASSSPIAITIAMVGVTVEFPQRGTRCLGRGAGGLGQTQEMTYGFRRSASLSLFLTAANPRPREILASSDCLFAPPSTSLLFLLFFFSSFFSSFLVASYDATLGQGPKAAPDAE